MSAQALDAIIERGDIVLNPIRSTTLIDEALTADFEAKIPRGHLGMSGIGNPDIRTQWLKFRWCLPDTPAPRTLRIFNLGNILEDEVVRLLKLAGFEVWEVDPQTGRQFNFKHLGGHFAGSADGIVRGIPESKKPHVLEIKSAKASKAKELQKYITECSNDNEALKKWNPDYFGQTQCYMNELELIRTLFVVYVKDTSELMTLRIEPEKFYWQGALSNAERIIASDTPPESSYPNRDWYEIKKYKSEEYQAVYWGEQLPPKAHCRNCRHALADMDASRTDAAWICQLKREKRDIEQQHKGCGDHNFLPSLMPAELIEVFNESNAVQYKTKDGFIFYNASEEDQSDNVFSSKELIELSKLELKKDVLEKDMMMQIRAEFGGRITDITPARRA